MKKALHHFVSGVRVVKACEQSVAGIVLKRPRQAREVFQVIVRGEYKAICALS